MFEPITMRSRFGIAVNILFWIIALSMIISFFWLEDPGASLKYLLTLFSVLAVLWWLYIAPRIDIASDQVHVVNLFREWTFNYEAIQFIDTKYTLTVRAEDQDISVWAAPAPSRYTVFRSSKREGSNLPESTYLAGTIRPGDLPATESGSAAFVLRRNWEFKRDNGLLTEEPSLTLRYRRGWMVALAVLLAVNIAVLGF